MLTTEIYAIIRFLVSVLVPEGMITYTTCTKNILLLAPTIIGHLVVKDVTQLPYYAREPHCT